MEFLTIFLSSLITLVSPAGVVIDRVAESTIRSQFEAVEHLQVRVDNAPSYQLVRGRVERVRIAGRGIFPLKEVRLDALELETDPIHVNAGSLRRGKPRLEEPLRAGVRLVIKQADVNRALRSPTVTNSLRKLGASVLDEQDAKRTQRYEVINPRIEFLANQRLRLQVELREPKDPATLKIFAESGIAVIAGRQLQLVQPIIRVDDEAVPEEVIKAISDGATEQLDLRQLESSGVTARVLQWQVNPDQINLAAFVQVAADRRLR